jgi:hypothetical protein
MCITFPVNADNCYVPPIQRHCPISVTTLSPANQLAHITAPSALVPQQRSSTLDVCSVSLRCILFNPRARAHPQRLTVAGMRGWILYLWPDRRPDFSESKPYVAHSKHFLRVHVPDYRRSMSAELSSGVSAGLHTLTADRAPNALAVYA